MEKIIENIGKREIQFKAWDVHKKEWFDENEDLPFTHDNTGDEKVYELLQEYDFKNDRWVLCQYTGLKDKNGKKIFEGDILTTSANVPDGVVMEDVFGGWIIRKNSICTELSILLENRWGIEIIGNIFENPELLPQ